MSFFSVLQLRKEFDKIGEVQDILSLKTYIRAIFNIVAVINNRTFAHETNSSISLMYEV